jgi:hypothetical protein
MIGRGISRQGLAVPREQACPENLELDQYLPEWDEASQDGSPPDRVRLAVLLAGVAVGLGGAYTFLVFLSLHHPALAFRQFVNDPRWDHVLGGPLVLANLLAAILLIGCRPEKWWKSRSLLLLAVSAAALGFWGVEHAHYFGWNQPVHRRSDDPFTVLCLRSIALVRIATLADLAAVIATVAEAADATRLRRATVRAAAVAFGLWLLLALTHIDWQHRPLQWGNIRDPVSYGLLVGSILARAISAGMAAILCGLAFKVAHRQAKEKRAREWCLLGERSDWL